MALDLTSTGDDVSGLDGALSPLTRKRPPDML